MEIIEERGYGYGGYGEDREALRLYIEELVRRPFDLSRDYKLRGHLIRIGEEEHVLAVTLHHVASDGWSMSILVEEFVALYEAGVGGRAAQLKVLPVQYSDYAIWQRRYLEGAVMEEKLDYWKEKLRGLEVLDMPTDYSRPRVQSMRGDVKGFSIGRELSEGMRRMSREEGVTVFMTLLSGLKVLLYRYSGQEDISVGSPIAGRQHQEVEGLIGFFVNTLVLRSDLGGNPSFRELLHRVRETTLDGYDHQEVPFEKVVEAVVRERDMSRSPLFQVMFVLQNNAGYQVGAGSLPGLEIEWEGGEVKTTKFDLTFSIQETEGGMEGWIEYCTDLYSGETVSRMAEHYRLLLGSIVADGEERIGELNMLGEKERHQLMEEFQGKEVEYPKDKTVVDLFREQVERTPDNVAVVFEEEEMSYRELNERANRLAHYLKDRYRIGPDDLVCLCVDRSEHMLTGILGVLKAGGAYVPMDPGYPEERIQFVVRDTGAKVVLTAGNEA